MAATTFERAFAVKFVLRESESSMVHHTPPCLRLGCAWQAKYMNIAPCNCSCPNLYRSDRVNLMVWGTYWPSTTTKEAPSARHNARADVDVVLLVAHDPGLLYRDALVACP